jgi:hypothetical protein
LFFFLRPFLAWLNLIIRRQDRLLFNHGTITFIFMRSIDELEKLALDLPESHRAALAARLPGSLSPVLDDEDEEMAEALRRDAELDANPSSGLSFEDLDRQSERRRHGCDRFFTIHIIFYFPLSEMRFGFRLCVITGDIHHLEWGSDETAEHDRRSQCRGTPNLDCFHGNVRGGATWHGSALSFGRTVTHKEVEP